MDERSNNGVLEEFRLEFQDCWQRLPNKGFFLGLFAAWLVLFQFLGNSTLGYARTSSLFNWMYEAYRAGMPHLFEGDEAYAVLIPGAVLFLFWLKRRELLALELKAWTPALLLVVAGLGLHVLGYLVQQPRLSILGMFTGFYGLTGLAWGPAWLRTSFFPFFLLGFCIPLGSLAIPITFRLRLLVCQLVEVICQYVLPFDVIRQGTQIFNPSGHYQYEVAAACSGIRSLTATLALAVILGFYSFRKWWKIGLMIMAAFPLAVLGNLLRMLAIIIAAEIGGQEWGNWVHEGGPLGIISLLPYVPAFIGLLTLENYLRGRPPSIKPRSPAKAPMQPANV
jgi:exosortase